MTRRTLPITTARTTTLSDARLIVGSVALLSGLAIVDRVAAWMIGEFPTSAILWELRFEYLRPVGVYYDVASARLGAISGSEFSVLLLIASAALIAGARSPIRLVRAACLHAVLVSCLALCAYSLDLIELAGAVGSPSSSYALLGAAIALPVLRSCLRIHAEYMGLDPASSRSLRRLRIAAMRMRYRLAERLAGGIEMLVPATGRIAIVLSRRDVVGDRRPRR